MIFVCGFLLLVLCLACALWLKPGNSDSPFLSQLLSTGCGAGIAMMVLSVLIFLWRVLP